MRRGIIGVVAVVALLALAATQLRDGGDDPGGEPRPIRGSGKQVAQVVTQLERATRQGRFEVVCDELFTRAARTRAGGGNCVRLLRSTARDVRRPRIRLLSVEINGKRAEARVRTRSQGQAAVEETIDFERERGRYRIAALRG